MSIQENIQKIQSEIPNGVLLVAVSKTKPEEAIEAAYEIGVRDFGENKVQELQQKSESLPKDINWHFIGHLQSNKVKYIAPYVHLIHAVDSYKLLETINKEALKNNRTINCLLQFHIAEEETKFGLEISEANEILKKMKENSLSNVNIVGVMGMGTNSEDETKVRNEFKNLKSIFETLKATCFSDKTDFAQISMGMSQDYDLAIEEGSTMVRIGSSIFGDRIY